MIHELKTWPEVFEPIMQGTKTAEYRKNDRNFKVGDVLDLREYEPTTKRYTGRKCLALVTHIVYGGQFGVPPEYCVMSIKVENPLKG